MRVQDFGLLEGINEVVCVTYSRGGGVNAAPLGVHVRGGRVFVRLFPSRSLENLRETGFLTANIVFDPLVFVRSALSSLGPGDFQESTGGVTVLRGAAGWVHFRAELEREGEPAVFGLTPIAGGRGESGFSAVNRGFNALIEALVHATRYRVFRRERDLRCIRYYAGIVRKCGRPVDLEALALLLDLLELDEDVSSQGENSI